MNISDVAAALAKVDRHVHFNRGCWWETVGPFFCKPVDPMMVLTPREAGPRVPNSLLGYSHVADDPGKANHQWSVMQMDCDALENFSISKLKSRKRSIVRKAIRELRIELIDDIDPLLDAMNEICISSAQRTEHGRPPEYYTERRNEWEQFMKREFSIPGRYWWAAHSGNSLIAYYYVYIINETAHISAAKSHSDFLKSYPNDALTFTVIEFCRELPECKKVVFGDWSPDNPNLNRFKERYGFNRVDLPIFRRERVSFSALSRMRQACRAMFPV